MASAQFGASASLFSSADFLVENALVMGGTAAAQGSAIRESALRDLTVVEREKYAGRLFTRVDTLCRSRTARY